MRFLKKNIFSVFRLMYFYMHSANYPFVAVLRLNDQCNLRCAYCDSYKLNKSIDFSRLENFLNKIYRQGCRFIILTGGEPFLYKDREKLNFWLKNKGIYLVINTNGQLVDKKDYTDFLDTADEVLVSVDGLETETEINRGSGTYNKIIQTLEYLFEKKIKITLSAVLAKNTFKISNLEHLKYLKQKYKASIGISPITENGRINSTEFSLNNQLTTSDLVEYKSYILKNKKYFPEIGKNLLNYFLAPQKFNCKTKQFAIYLDVDEKIYPCINVTGRADAIIGDITGFPEGKSKSEIICNKCSCTPLINGNLMLSTKNDKIKLIYEILFRYF